MSDSGETLIPRQRRALFRAWHRGTKEMDILMGRFADAEISTMSDDDLSHFEALLEVPEQEIFGWISGKTEPPTAYDTGLFRRIVQFHKDGGAIHPRL